MKIKNRRIRAKKVRQIKVATLAAYSRQFTVNNNTIPRVDPSNLVEIEKPWGKVLAEKGVVDYKVTHHKQPKQLQKKYNKKYYLKGTHTIRKIVIRPSDYTAFKNFLYTLPKMNKVQYMEKLVEHKLSKWERKNVCPEAVFTEDVERWKQEREAAKERFRDFVVSIYDPLWIMGNRVDTKNAKMKASKIAEVKDTDGKGHDVYHPNLNTEDKLYKDANKKAQEAMNKDASILDADLMNHKRNQKRPLLNAKRAKTVTLADKKFKKAA